MRLLLVAATLAFLFAGCSSDPADNPSGDRQTVSVKDGSFNPTTVNLLVDSALEWTNEGNNSHTVTADDGSFDSGDMAKGAKFTQEFESAGTFGYHCKYHAKMVGTIKVA